jgi:F-type H+-transporting ATPase subunit delta
VFRHSTIVARRAFATNPLSQTKPLKPTPVPLSGAVGTYTAALWSAAAEKNATAAVTRDAKTFTAALKEPALARYIANPFVAKPERIKALANIGKKLGLHDVSKSFLNVLVANNRISGAGAVFEAFLDCSKAAEGKMEGVLTTAAPLSDTEYTAISKQINTVTAKVLGGATKGVNLERRVDPTVVSGVLVKFGNFELDLTGRTHVNKTLGQLLDQLISESNAYEQELIKLSES